MSAENTCPSCGREFDVIFPDDGEGIMVCRHCNIEGGPYQE